VLRGAADTVMKVARKGDKIDIINIAPQGKQKDAEEFPAVKLRTTKVRFQQNGEEHTTLVLNLREDEDEPEGCEASAGPKLGVNEQAVIDALKKAGEPLGLMRLTAMTEANKGSVSRALNNLVDKNLVSVDLDASGNTKLWALV
jgi:hypothetical protein